MKRIVLFFLLLPFLAAQPAADVEITAEPSHHLILENENVRVFRVEVAPHTATLMHEHRRDYVYVTIGDARHRTKSKASRPSTSNLPDGETRFVPGNFAHIVIDLSEQPFRNITIELVQDEKLRKTPSPWPEESGEKTFPGGRSKTFFVKDAVRVSEFALEPGATLPSHHHDGPHLAVAITSADLRGDVEGVGPRPAKFSAGDIKWLPGGFTHTLTNVGKTPVRLVTVEF